MSSRSRPRSMPIAPTAGPSRATSTPARRTNRASGIASPPRWTSGDQGPPPWGDGIHAGMTRWPIGWEHCLEYRGQTDSLLSRIGGQGQQQRPPALEQVAAALSERATFVERPEPALVLARRPRATATSARAGASLPPPSPSGADVHRPTEIPGRCRRGSVCRFCRPAGSWSGAS